MNRVLAILFSIFTLGAFSETRRIFTSNAPDIVTNRPSLMIISVLLTCGLLYLALQYWMKSSRNN